MSWFTFILYSIGTYLRNICLTCLFAYSYSLNYSTVWANIFSLNFLSIWADVRTLKQHMIYSTIWCIYEYLHLIKQCQLIWLPFCSNSDIFNMVIVVELLAEMHTFVCCMSWCLSFLATISSCERYWSLSEGESWGSWDPLLLPTPSSRFNRFSSPSSILSSSALELAAVL